MIRKGTILYPQWITAYEMYYNNKPYAYWVSEPSINFCNWILYKEYNDYVSTCSPNDCLSALSYEEVIKELKTASFYDGMDRKKLCNAFRQRSLNDNLYEFEDFITE